MTFPFSTGSLGCLSGCDVLSLLEVSPCEQEGRQHPHIEKTTEIKTEHYNAE
jgi:hypothetical protein